METIYLPDNIHPVIKLERLPDSDTELDDAKPAGERTKMGEIFQTTRDHLTFVCTHCSSEFSLFMQFTSHIEQHLQAIFASKVEPPAIDSTTACPLEISSDLETIWNDIEATIEENPTIITPTNWDEIGNSGSDTSDESEPHEPTDNAVQLDIVVQKRQGGFECPQCGKKCKNTTGLNIHLTRKHSNEQYKCTACSKIHTTVDTFTKHVKHCQIYNDQQKQLNREISNNLEQQDKVDPPISFECFQCHEPLATEIECKVHVRNHLNAEKTCEHCARIIKSKVSERLHRRYCKPPAVPEPPTECPVCSQAFASYGRYFVHAREDHRLTVSQMRQKRITKCGRCFLEFNTRIDYEKHLESHKSLHHIREHTCNLCGKMYQNYFSYKMHMQRHEGKGLFKCKICNNTYSKYYRKIHMKSHSGEKKYQCNECGALWTSMALLRNHMMTHTNEKPHQCEFCERSFRKRFLLQAHRRLHTGEYVHYCKSCEKGYTDKNGLKKHNLKVHGLVYNEDKNLTKRREIW